MKVLIIRNAFTHDFGGAERLPVHIASHLQSHNISPTLVSRQPRTLEYASAEGIKNTYRGLWWPKQNWSGTSIFLVPLYIGWEILLMAWYLQLMLRLKPDAVHILSKDDFIAATPIARLLKKPVIWTDCADLKFLYQNHKVWYKNPVGKLVYAVSKLATKVTLVSNNEKSLIENSLQGPVPSNYQVIHIGARAQSTTPVARKDSEKNAVIFCATSRLVVAKGIGELVKAFNVLSKDTDAYRLWLVGDGPDEAQFKEYAAGNPHIVFLGHQGKPLPFVAAADVFVHPTYHEGFSLSLSEAAMLGKPLIATRVGGNPEIVNEDNGILVPVQDVDSLAAAMQKLGTDPTLRAAMGKRAHDDYFSKFEFDQVVEEKITPLYEQVQS